MIRHSNSFIFSIFIHIALVALVYLSYKQISVGIKEETKEPLLCIKLSPMCRPTPKTETKQVKTPIKKKIEKKKIKKKAPTKVKVVKIVAKKKEEKALVKLVKSVTVAPKKKEEVKVVVAKKVLTKEVIVNIKKETTPEKKYIDENIAKIIALLQENLHYPRRARKRGIQGEVLVRFTLSVNAQVSNIMVISAESDILSRGAVQTIKNIDNKLPKPKQTITFNIPISYTLR